MESETVFKPPDPLRLHVTTVSRGHFACSVYGRKYCQQCDFAHVAAACRAVTAALADPLGIGWSFSPDGTGWAVRIEEEEGLCRL